MTDDLPASYPAAQMPIATEQRPTQAEMRLDYPPAQVPIASERLLTRVEMRLDGSFSEVVDRDGAMARGRGTYWIDSASEDDEPLTSVRHNPLLPSSATADGRHLSGVPMLLHSIDLHELPRGSIAASQELESCGATFNGDPAPVTLLRDFCSAFRPRVPDSHPQQSCLS